MKKITLFITIVLFSSQSFAQLIKDKNQLSDINRMLKVQQILISQSKNLPWEVYKSDLSRDELQAMNFLYAYMPLSDLADYKPDFFLRNVRASLKAREEMPWTKSLPEEIYLHYVLPVRVNNENLDSFRFTMYDELKERVKNLKIEDAALEINHWCHQKVTYQGSDERTSSPLSTMRYSFGRCGEESVFTVAALRTVGIPARQVYTPRWAHTDDNHAWVEIWANGKWYYLGACEPDAYLNRGWFSYPATRAMLVHTRAYGKYFGNEEIITNEERFGELNVINTYAETKRFYVKVLTENGKPLPGANVDFRLYNYAEFYPIAKKLTDNQGITFLTSGKGTLLIWASKGDKSGFRFIRVADIDTVSIVLKKQNLNGTSIKVDLIPPVGNPDNKIASAEDNLLIEKNNRRLKEEDSIRGLYMKTFWNQAQIMSFANENGYDYNSIKKNLTGSYGNWKEISTFLKMAPDDKKFWAIQLLLVISEKDLRDATSEVLLNHLINSDYDLSGDTAVFCKYVLNPRIGTELLTGWRSAFKNKQNKLVFDAFKSNPEKLAAWVDKNIRLELVANQHSRTLLSPIGVMRYKTADKKSKDVFFVVLCRDFGIPARLNPETLTPQYFAGNEWVNVWFDNSKPEVNPAYGSIQFIDPGNGLEGKYSYQFTIARFHNGVYETLLFDEGKSLKEFVKQPVNVIAGDYMLVTGNRQENGSVLCNTRFFKVAKDSLTSVEVTIRNPEFSLKNYGNFNLNVLKITNAINKQTLDLTSESDDKGLLIIYIDPDKEPTKHVLKDIQNIKENLDKWGAKLVVIFKDGRLPDNFDEKYFPNLPEKTIFAFDTNNELYYKILDTVKNEFVREYPLICVLKADGTIVYYSAGYKIGVDQEIKKVISGL